MNNYLSNIEMASLVEAIQQAENQSTGEIRVHIDKPTVDNNAKVAFDVFKKLGMDKTKERNAVLFHVNFEKNTLPSLVIKESTKKYIKNFGMIYTTKSHTLFPKANISRFA
jgi:uncharacterized membrane protein